MDRIVKGLNFEHLYKVLSLLSECTDDYLFIYDLQLDEYFISEKAVDRFLLEDSKFDNAVEKLERVCYSDDFARLNENINGIKRGTVNEHNMEYRWLDKSGQPVWINCHGQIVKDEGGLCAISLEELQNLGAKIL